MRTLDTTKITSKFLYEHSGGNSLRMGRTIYCTCMLFLTARYTKGIMQIKSRSNLPTKYGLDVMLILQGLYSMNQLFKMQKVFSGYMLFSYNALLYKHLMNNCSHD